MSAYLGPIHYWVFNKIKFQSSIIEKLVEVSKQKNFDIATILDASYENLENAPLEEIIDGSNIHGWLQSRVSLVEYRLAKAVKILLENSIFTKEELQQLFHQIGVASSKNSIASAKDAYKLLNDLLLDGMPCDRVNELISESEEEVIWQRRICIHSSYWNEVGIDINIYYQLRESIITGLLEKTSYTLVKDGEKYKIIRKEI